MIITDVDERESVFHQFAPEDLSDPPQSVPLTQITWLALTLYDSEAPDPTVSAAVLNSRAVVPLIVDGAVQTTSPVTGLQFAYAQDPADGRWKASLVFLPADMAITGECRSFPLYVAAYRIETDEFAYTHEKGFRVKNLRQIPSPPVTP